MKPYIINRIRHGGPITVATWMHEVLLHPHYGYYHHQNPFGKQGDFVTAPEISQLFGEMIGLWCLSQWEKQGKKPVQLIELGPGRGTLMADIVRSTKHIAPFQQGLTIHLVEASASLRSQQKQLLHQARTIFPVYWYEKLDEIVIDPSSLLLLVANEFFDALPIHQYVRTEQGWKERVLAWNEKKAQLGFTLTHASLPAGYFGAGHARAPQGGLLEICPAGIRMVEAIAAKIAAQSGAALMIDYGYTEYSYRSSLQAVKEHHYHPLLEDMGQADITAHVDFAALSAAASKYQITVDPVITQAEFLEYFAIHFRAHMLMQRATEAQKEALGQAVHRLTSDQEMGKLFKVLSIQGKYT